MVLKNNPPLRGRVAAPSETAQRVRRLPQRAAVAVGFGIEKNKTFEGCKMLM